MNVGRSEYTRLVRIEAKYNRIIELSDWSDECLEMLALLSFDAEADAYLDCEYTAMEACNELRNYLQEIKS